MLIKTPQIWPRFLPFLLHSNPSQGRCHSLYLPGTLPFGTSLPRMLFSHLIQIKLFSVPLKHCFLSLHAPFILTMAHTIFFFFLSKNMYLLLFHCTLICLLTPSLDCSHHVGKNLVLFTIFST